MWYPTSKILTVPSRLISNSINNILPPSIKACDFALYFYNVVRRVIREVVLVSMY